MTFYDVNGAQLAVFEAGTDVNGTIITLHGGRGAGDHRSDFRAYQPLVEAGFRVISYDQRGHGESSQTNPLTYEQLADDFEALRLQLVGKPVIVLGGSFGGYIALTYALKYPGSYSHLILRATSPSWHHEIKALANVREAAKRWPDIDVERYERLFLGVIDDADNMRANSRSIAPLADGRLYDPAKAGDDFKQSRLETARELFRVGHQYDVRDRLHEILAPTLILAGTEDWTCTVDNSYLMVERIPNSQLLVVGGAPHAVHVDSGDLVRTTIVDFIARHPFDPAKAA